MSVATHTDTVLGTNTHSWHYRARDVAAQHGDRHDQQVTAVAAAPTLLVHGFRGDHHGLEPVARALLARDLRRQVIVPDLPGFGATAPVPGRTHDLDLYGEWLCRYAATVAGETGAVTIIGHSFGSLVVANALAQGLACERIVLINPIAAPALDGPRALLTRATIGYYTVANHLPERAARALLGNPIIVRLMSEVMVKTRDRTLRAWIHDQHRRYFSDFADPGTLLQAFHASIAHTVTQYTAAFHAPTLLIAGERDDITPLSAGLALAKRINTATLRVLPNVGHLVHYEAAGLAADAIIEFEQTLTAAAAEATR